jgi:hypothetical protein
MRNVIKFIKYFCAQSPKTGLGILSGGGVLAVIFYLHSDIINKIDKVEQRQYRYVDKQVDRVIEALETTTCKPK